MPARSTAMRSAICCAIVPLGMNTAAGLPSSAATLRLEAGDELALAVAVGVEPWSRHHSPTRDRDPAATGRHRACGAHRRVDRVSAQPRRERVRAPVRAARRARILALRAPVFARGPSSADASARRGSPLRRRLDRVGVRSYASMIFCTSGWRTTSALVKRVNAMPRTPARMRVGLDEPALLPAREVDLRDVAGDHRLGAEADAGQEHLHLLGRRVLRLVEDDERVVERAAAHVGERRDLDRAALEELAGLVEAHQVVQRVVERAQVRVDLLREVAGQEAQALAGLDRGPDQHEPLDRVALQRVDGAGDGEVGLAGAGRADAERDVVLVRCP